MYHTLATLLAPLLLATINVQAQSAATASAPDYAEQITFLTYRTELMQGDQSHHHNMSALWKDKLEPAARVAAYPFQSGNYTDFVPIFEDLIANHPRNTCGLIDDDAWATPFVQPGKDLVAQADDAKARGDNETAYELYLRAQTVFRISHFPWIGPGATSQVKIETFNLSKNSIRSAMTVNANLTFEEVTLPYNVTAGTDPDAKADFPIWIFGPASDPSSALPTILLLGGLGLNKPDQMETVSPLVELGYRIICLDMPGTGDAPITGRYNNQSSDSVLWDSVVDYFKARPGEFDLSNVYAYGPSTAAYYIFRMMYTHGENFVAGVGQGGPVHYSFEADWLQAARNLSYPCDLPVALGHAFGYDTPLEFIQNAWRYSLINQTMLGRTPPAQIVAVDGFLDLVYPIDDPLLLAQYSCPVVALETSNATLGCGPTAMLRFFPHRDNTGEDLAFPWVQAYFSREMNLIKGKQAAASTAAA